MHEKCSKRASKLLKVPAACAPGVAVSPPGVVVSAPHGKLEDFFVHCFLAKNAWGTCLESRFERF